MEDYLTIRNKYGQMRIHSPKKLNTVTTRGIPSNHPQDVMV